MSIYLLAGIRLTWISGDKNPQQVQYGDGKSQASQVSTFTQNDMCSSILPSPAKDFGWHDLGYIHSAFMTWLNPSTQFSYRYGSDSVGWSNRINFPTPPAGGEKELKFLAFGDMGKAHRDASSLSFLNYIFETLLKSLSDPSDQDLGIVTY
ncbi:hypothetical protein L6452_01600 [Arctium lappa]|uniref:Uncharacterized protein n=1 Tax=Arctium lappa TaxID=4217 RepID=A0ACB9FHJ3_ARCLA|nr:hypothetical protein L6452_01600 [Arctium lappa]